MSYCYHRQEICKSAVTPNLRFSCSDDDPITSWLLFTLIWSFSTHPFPFLSLNHLGESHSNRTMLVMKKWFHSAFRVALRPFWTACNIFYYFLYITSLRQTIENNKIPCLKQAVLPLELLYARSKQGIEIRDHCSVGVQSSVASAPMYRWCYCLHHLPTYQYSRLTVPRVTLQKLQGKKQTD